MTLQDHQQKRDAAKEQRKERHSADPKSNISCGATQKKQGHGGAFTWEGSHTNDPENVDDYVTNPMAKHVPGVQVAPAAAAANGVVNPKDFDIKKCNTTDFPPLEGGSVPNSPEKTSNEDAWAKNVALDSTLTI